MTEVADAAVGFEARLVRCTKKRDKDGQWAEIAFQVEPGEAMPMFLAALGSRWQIGAVELGDDEQPRPQRKFSEMPRSQQAAIMLHDKAFCDYIGGGDEALKLFLGIKSKRQLDDAGFSEEWDNLLDRFNFESGRTPKDYRGENGASSD